MDWVPFIFLLIITNHVYDSLAEKRYRQKLHMTKPSFYFYRFGAGHGLLIRNREKQKGHKKEKKGVVKHDSLIIKSLYITTDNEDPRHFRRVNILLFKHLGDGTSYRCWVCQFGQLRDQGKGEQKKDSRRTPESSLTSRTRGHLSQD